MRNCLSLNLAFAQSMPCYTESVGKPATLQRETFPSHLVTAWASEPFKLGFLERYHQRRAKFYKASAACGLGPDTVKRWMAKDPEFTSAVRFIQQLWADDVEDGLVDEPGPVGKIVILKAIRPAEYIERQAVLNLTLEAGEIPAEAWRTLLATVAGALSPSARERLALPSGLEPTLSLEPQASSPELSDSTEV